MVLDGFFGNYFFIFKARFHVCSYIFHKIRFLLHVTSKFYARLQIVSVTYKYFPFVLYGVDENGCFDDIIDDIVSSDLNEDGDTVFVAFNAVFRK